MQRRLGEHWAVLTRAGSSSGWKEESETWPGAAMVEFQRSWATSAVDSSQSNQGRADGPIRSPELETSRNNLCHSSISVFSPSEWSLALDCQSLWCCWLDFLHRSIKERFSPKSKFLPLLFIVPAAEYAMLYDPSPPKPNGHILSGKRSHSDCCLAQSFAPVLAKISLRPAWVELSKCSHFWNRLRLWFKIGESMESVLWLHTFCHAEVLTV